MRKSFRMKNYKTMLFVAVSIIIASNNHIAQSGNSIPSQKYENGIFLLKLQDKLRKCLKSDYNAIVTTGRRKFAQEKPENSSQRFEIMHTIILERVKLNTRFMLDKLINDQYYGKVFTNARGQPSGTNGACASARLVHNPAYIDDIMQSSIDNAKAKLERNNCLGEGVLTNLFTPRIYRCFIEEHLKKINRQREISNIHEKCSI